MIWDTSSYRQRLAAYYTRRAILGALAAELFFTIGMVGFYFYFHLNGYPETGCRLLYKYFEGDPDPRVVPFLIFTALLYFGSIFAGGNYPLAHCLSSLPFVLGGIILGLGQATRYKVLTAALSIVVLLILAGYTRGIFIYTIGIGWMGGDC